MSGNEISRQNKRSIGSDREEAAAAYLAAKGYKILARNFRTRQGEIDLVARDGKYLVFVEVKYRKSGSAGTPLEAVSPLKQRQISKIALFYLNRYKLGPDQPVRFDVVGVSPGGITHVENAFDFCYY